MRDLKKENSKFSMNNFLKIQFIVAFLILMISNGYSAYEYNETYENLTLFQNGWCLYQEIPFTTYNSSDWEEKKEIESNLCAPGCKEDCNDEADSCIECKRDCREFSVIKAKVKLYDGPSDSNPLLLDTNLGTNNTFKYTFNETKLSLLEILPEGKYNDYHVIINGPESDIYTQVCTGVKNPEDIKEEIKIKLVNKSYNYLNSEVLVNIKNSNINSSTDIVTEFVYVNELENQIKAFKLSSEKITFSTMDVEIVIDKKQNSEIKAFKLENTIWEEIPIKETENKVIFENVDFGTYAITEKEEEIEEIVIQEEIEDLIIEEEIETEEVQESSSDLNWGKWILYAGISLVLVVVVFVISKSYKGQQQSRTESPKVEVLTSYNETYKKTKEYVQKHKQDYLKDQIYRALKNSNIPKDIIDKVFVEEYK